MEKQHAKDLREGVRVAVLMGAAVSAIYGTPPIVTTATCLGAPGEGIPDGSTDFVWLGVDFTVNDDALPQMYRVEEIIGFMLPLATTTHHPDGSVTGTVPLEGS